MNLLHSASASSEDVLPAKLDGRAIRHLLNLDACPTVWREWGEGPALVLLHGGHGSWMHWIRNIETLAQHFRVLVPDMPGFGDSEDFSTPPQDAQRMEQLLSNLRQGIERLVPQGPILLAGFSFGGAVAGLLASQLPRLQRLVLLGCGGHGGARRDQTPLLNWRAVSGIQRQQALAQNLRTFMLTDSASQDPLALRIHTLACEATRFRSKTFSRSTKVLDGLRQFEKPVFLIWGEDDVTAVPSEAIKALTQERDNRDWTIVARSGHWVQFEKSDEINTLLISWLQPESKYTEVTQ